MTLLELTVVILVLLILSSLLVVGAGVWKKGSDRAVCVLNLMSVQKGLRSFSNLYGHSSGESVAGLKDKIIGEMAFVVELPVCPHQGTYEFTGDTIPPIGTLYMTCSLSASEQHFPTSCDDW